MIPQLMALSCVFGSSFFFDARRCASADQRVLACHNASHYGFRHCGTGEWLRGQLPCRAGFACQSATGTCQAMPNATAPGGGGLATHLLRSVDYQIVETVVASEATACAADATPPDPTADELTGRMLCEVLHATAVVQPTFGHSLGNTWV